MKGGGTDILRTKRRMLTRCDWPYLGRRAPKLPQYTTVVSVYDVANKFLAFAGSALERETDEDQSP